MTFSLPVAIVVASSSLIIAPYPDTSLKNCYNFPSSVARVLELGPICSDSLAEIFIARKF